MTSIYIVRHCEAMGNVDRIFHGLTDSDISENGERQLEKLSERFAGIPIDAVYSSPLKRTRLTAEAINRHHGLPIEFDNNLIEINGGVIEGLPWKQLPVKYPEYAQKWNLAPHEFVVQGGESMAQVFERGFDAVLKIAQQNAGKTVALASHGCLIRNIICRANALPIEQLSTVEWCDNTGVTLLRFSDEWEPEIVFFNDASHLDEGLSTFAKQTWWRRDRLSNLEFD